MLKKCKVKGCDNNVFCKGYCSRHYKQVYRYGKILERTKFDLNEIIDCGDYYEICLYKGQVEQKEVARAKIDKEDLDKVKDIKWGLNNYGYVINKKIKLHQLVIGKKEGYIIDHINHNKLDNRKQNLRHCTYSQNGMNRECNMCFFKKDRNKWIAYITINYKRINLGYFKNKIDAINARKEAEIKYFGEYRYDNELNN